MSYFTKQRIFWMFLLFALARGGIAWAFDLQEAYFDPITQEIVLKTKVTTKELNTPPRLNLKECFKSLPNLQTATLESEYSPLFPSRGANYTVKEFRYFIYDLPKLCYPVNLTLNSTPPLMTGMEIYVSGEPADYFTYQGQYVAPKCPAEKPLFRTVSGDFVLLIDQKQVELLSAYDGQTLSFKGAETVYTTLHGEFPAIVIATQSPIYAYHYHRPLK